MSERRAGQGFILVFVLWILLALSVSVSALALWVSQSTDQALQQSNEMRAQVGRFATRETLKFLLATRPSRTSGLYMGEAPQQLARSWRARPMSNERVLGSPSDLHFDGTVYQGLQGGMFSIQDEAGLVGVNQFIPERLEALLNQMDVPAARRARLQQRLREFADFMPNPSRDAEYRMLDLPPPPGRYLLSSMEIRNIPGWRDPDLPVGEMNWVRYTTALVSGPVNLNTAPVELLTWLPSIGPGRAELLVEARRTAPFPSVDQAAELIGRRLDVFSFRTIPSEVLRLTLGDRFSERALRYTVRLTGSRSQVGPWRIESVHPLSGVDFDPASAQPVAQSLLAATPLPGEE
jgi:type II secretory pathway component PulK